MSLPAPDQLGLSLFGTPGVTFANKPLVIPRRQVRALLYRLAVENRPLSRSNLDCLFWGDLPESTAHRNLSRLLTYLSKNLPDPNFLQSDEDHIQLDPARIWVDTREFHHCWNGWERMHRFEDLQAAVQLYRGTFLDGFFVSGSTGFAMWVDSEAECWEQRYLKALETLMDESNSQGDIAHAIDYALQYLRHNNLAESIHCRLIEFYTALGDRSAALRQYALCSEVLEHDLGVKPAPETQAAYQAVFEQQPFMIKEVAVTPAWNASRSLQPPFIGREAILLQLSQCLKRARSGHGGVVLVGGEAGIGKTRLLQEFSRGQRLRTRLVAASTSPESSSMPYQPIIEGLRSVLRTSDILPLIHSPWLLEASRLMPELGAMIQQEQFKGSLGTGEARARIFEALCHILFSLSRGGYVVLLCLDDLQWADSTTLDWMAYLSRRLQGQRVLVIGTYRIDERVTLSGLRQTLARQTNFTEVSLQGLNRDEVWALISSMDRSTRADQEQADLIFRVTDGNPFFVLETMRVTQETHPPLELGTDQNLFPLPDTVRQAVNYRLDKLNVGARQLLDASAVLGLDFDFVALLLTAGSAEMETLDGLDELVRRQFIIEREDGYQFCHAIVREAVYAGLSHWRRRVLHRRAGEALEKLRADDVLALAWHFERAGEPGRAATYLHQAGQAARAVFAHVEARNCFDRALALLDQKAGSITDSAALASNRQQRIRVVYDRGWVLRLLGEMDAYTRDLEEVARLAQDLDNPQILAHLYWQQAYNQRWFCSYDSARSSAEKGIYLSREIGDIFLEAACLRELGMVARETGDYAQAQSDLERALDMFTQAQNIPYQIHILGNLSTLYCYLQNLEQAQQKAHQALELCEQNNLHYERRLPLGDIGVVIGEMGNLRQARTHLEESLSIAREISDRSQEIFCLGHLGNILGKAGEYKAAEKVLSEALSLAETIGSVSEQSWLHASWAEVLIQLGHFSQAEAHAHRAQEIAQAHGRITDTLLAHQLLIRCCPPDGA